MYGYVYMTTNLVNNKKYIGAKKSTYFRSDYLGSGRKIKEAINEFGKNNFSVEIIERIDEESQDKLFEREYYWTNYYNAVESEDFYNLRSGGNRSGISNETFELMSKSQSKRVGPLSAMYGKGYLLQGEKNGMYGKHHTEETRKKMRENHVKELSEEHKQKVSQSLIGNQRAKGKHWTLGDETRQKLSNALKGRIIINNGVIIKRIKPEDLSFYEQQGFVKGCKLKRGGINEE